MRVGRVRGTTLRAGRLRRRLAAAVSAAALAVLGMMSGGAPALAAPGAAPPPASAHKAPFPSVVHPAKPPQRAAGTASKGTGTVVVPGNQPRSQVSKPAYSASMRAQLSAQAQARRAGRPVVVPALTTPTQQVIAQPNGTYELQSSVYPVRIQRNGTWVPVSTRLVPASGGWAPAAVSTPVVFSAGGAGPLVTLTDPGSGGTVRVWWPSPLPKPAVSGDVALYRSVLPGADLRLEATNAGYSDVLVVRDAAAAANPALRALPERVQVSAGLRASQGPGGSLAVTTADTQKVVLTFGQPMMWDSSDAHPRIAIRPSADFAGSGRVTTIPVAYQASGTGVTTVIARPPAAALAGPAVRYPLFVDPQTGDVKTSYYAEVMHDSVQNQAWTTTSANTSVGSNMVEIGYCGFSDCGRSDGASTYTMRTYYRFSTSELVHSSGSPGATVYYVDFNVQQTSLADHSCTAQPAHLWSTSAGIGSGTTWPGPADAVLATGSSNAGGTAAGGGCGPGFLNIAGGSGSALVGNLQNGANKAVSTMAFMLSAQDESNDLQYRVVSDNATLDVYYNYPPNTPAGLRVDNETTCTSTVYTSDNSPTLYATGTDNNSPELNLDWNFTAVDSAGTSHGSGWLDNGTAGYAPDVERFWTSPALPEGASHFSAFTRNVPTDGRAAQLSSDTSPAFDFTIASAAPAKPSLSSFDYPPAQWGQAKGEPGTFTVTPGDSATVGFSYAFDATPATVPQGSGSPACDYLKQGGLGTSVDANDRGVASGVLGVGPDGTSQILAPASLAPGRHTLSVMSFNGAHVQSAGNTATYTFYVPANYQSATSYTNASTLVSSATTSPSGLAVSQANCCGLTWPSGAQLRFAGTAAQQSFTVPVTIPGSGTAAVPWQMGAFMTKSWNYGKVQVDMDKGTSAAVNLGGTATVPFDGYTHSSSRVTGGYLDLGTPSLVPGSAHTLTFTLVGTDSGSGYEAGLVYLAIGATSRYQADSLAGLPTSGQPHQQCLNEATWADDCQLMFTNAAAGASFSVNFYAPVESDYALGANLVTAKDYGTEQFAITDPNTGCVPLYGTTVNSTGGCVGATAADGTSIALDAYTTTVSAQYAFLGSAHLTPGWHTLQVTVNDKNTSSASYNAGINFVEAVPVTGAKVSSFTAAMNNQGIAYDGAASTTMTSNMDLTNTASGNNLSEQSLAAAGLITTASAAGKAWAGKTFSLNGAQFTMPAPRVDGSGNVIADNVIPDGQTIPFPAAQQVPATAVALLATATCHTSPEATVAINYATGSSNRTIPPVPDWLAGTQGPTVISLGSYDTGTTRSAARQPQLYEVMLPASPSSPLSSINLPVTGLNFLPGSGGCGSSPNILHIMAMGVVPAASAVVPGADGGGVWTGAYDGPMDTAVTCCQTMADETFREQIPVSAAGDGYVRIHLSNAYSTGQVTFDDVTLAAWGSAGGGSTAAAPVQLRFGGAATLTLPAGGDAVSDPVAMPALVAGRGRLIVSMHIPASDTTIAGVPIHDQVQGLGTYYAPGDVTSNSDGTPYSSANSLDGEYYLAGVDVSNSAVATPVTVGGTTYQQYTGTVAVLGDQGAISAPAYSGGNWASYLPAALGSATAGGVSAPVNVAGSIADAATGDSMPDDWWRLNGGGADSGTTAYDSGLAAVSNLTLKGAAPAWSTSVPGTRTTSGSLKLDGSTQYGITQSPPAVPSGSFAVSAWVNPTAVPASGDAVAVARNGSSASEYYLGTHNGNWGFWFTGSDAASPAVTGAYGAAATTGAWTLLTGVYASGSGQIQLYVNGARVATTSLTPSWTAAGALTVGSGLAGGSQADFWPGYVSDVRYYNRVMWGYNVQQAYQDTGMSSMSATGVASAMTSDQATWGSSGWIGYQPYAAGQPNLRDVIISLGANDVLQNEPEKAIETSLLAIVTTMQGWSLPQSPSTPVNVFVTTIPPLGLSSADPREALRQSVNSWILGGAGNASVQNLPPASIVGALDITPAYPSGGLSAPADYQAVATLVANDIAAWIKGGHGSLSHPAW